MSNIKLAFERYLEFQVSQRRTAMLQWCKESVSINISTHAHDAHSMLLPMLLDFSHKKLIRVKRNLQICKNDFSTTRTHYFDNNFDVIVDRNVDPNMILEEANQKMATLKKLFGDHRHDKTNEPLKSQVITTFNWLYVNRLYSLCFDLIRSLPEPKYLYFVFQQFPELCFVLNKYGSQGDILELFKAFRGRNTVQYLPLIANFSGDVLPLLVEFSRSTESTLIGNFNRLSTLDLKRFDDKSAFFSLLTKICGYLITQMDSMNEVNQLIQSMLESFIPKDEFAFDCITRVYDKLLEISGPQSAIEFISKLTNDNAVTYNDKKSYVFAALKHGNKSVIFSTYMWMLMFPDVQLVYNDTPDELLLLRQRWIFTSEPDLSQIAGLDKDNVNISKLISILIYGYSHWGSASTAIELYHYAKEQNNITITQSDLTGVLRSLVHLHEYSKALDFIDECSRTSHDFFSADTYDSIFLCMAKGNKWDELKDLFDALFKKERVTTIKQYSVMFMVLASRGATKHLLNLWDTFVKRGYKPNDMILCSIIFCFIKTQSYTKALQWFTAYSYFKVPLSTKSYGLMLNALASTHDIASCFKMLDELSAKDLRLSALQMQSFLQQCALLGDHRSVELILSRYYPLFNLPVTSKEKIWILKAHYHGNRFGTVVEAYQEKLAAHEPIDYEDTLLALESASKFTSTKEFTKIWNSALEMYGNKLTVEAYIKFMGVYVRNHGLSGAGNILNTIQKKLHLKYLPVKMFNEMIFSCIRMGKPWCSPMIVKMSLSRGVIPNSKMYSLLLQSNTSIYSYSEQHIDETIKLLNEILLNRKEDKLGKLDKDLNPMSFKLIIMHILKFRGAEEARKYFELYVENSKNYLLDNIHILNIELMILGEENRWEEFAGCYDRFITILKSKMKYCRLDPSASPVYDMNSIGRIGAFSYPEKSSINEKEVIYGRMPTIRIPSSLRNSLFTVWPYRLKYLSDLEQLGDIMKIVDELYSDGFVLSTKNLNETALALSSHEELITATVAFMNKYILPGHIAHRRLAISKVRYRMNDIPNVHDSSVHFINGIYFQIMKNLDNILSARLTPLQKNSLLDSIMMSDTATIMKNLRSIADNSDKIQNICRGSNKKSRKFYQERHHSTKMRREFKIRLEKCDKVNKMINYRKRWLELHNKRGNIMANLKKETDENSRYHLLHEKAEIRQQFKALRNERRDAFRAFKEEKLRLRKDDEAKIYKVGDANLYRIQTSTRLDPLKPPLE